MTTTANDVNCPTCLANAGEPCMTRTGKVAAKPHSDRIHTAQTRESDARAQEDAEADGVEAIVYGEPRHGKTNHAPGGQGVEDIGQAFADAVNAGAAELERLAVATRVRWSDLRPFIPKEWDAVGHPYTVPGGALAMYRFSSPRLRRRIVQVVMVKLPEGSVDLVRHGGEPAMFIDRKAAQAFVEELAEKFSDAD